MRCAVQLLGHPCILFGHCRVDVLDGRSGVQKRRGRDRFDMTAGERRVSIAGEDDLALLGQLEATIDRTARLGEHGFVRRSTTAADGAAATMEEREVDIVRLSPAGNAVLCGVERKRCGGRAGILRRVGVSQHDLHAAPVVR